MKVSAVFIGIFLSVVLLVGKGICRSSKIAAQSIGALRGARIAMTTTPSGEIDRIYIAREHEIQCLDKGLNRVIWTSHVSAGTVDVGPIVHGGTVAYVSDDMSTVTGLNTDNGSLKWSTAIQTAHITGDNKTVFLATSTGMGVQALDAETGKRIWKYEPGGPGSIYQLVYTNGRIYTDAYVLSATNGLIVKKNASTANIIDARADTIFKVIGDGTIEAFRTRTNSVVWKAVSDRRIYPIAISVNDRFLFFVGYSGMPFIARKGFLWAFDVSDGHAAWELPIATGDGGLQPDPIASDYDNVYLLSPAADFSTWLSDISVVTGKQVWSHDLKGKIDGPPLVVGGVLYLTDGPDVLYEIDKRSGSVLLRDELPKELR